LAKEKKYKMNVSSFISLKYFFSKSKLHIVNIISSIAVFVLIVASCSFFVVLSVFSGLKDFGLQYNRSFSPDILISNSSGAFKTSEKQLDFLEKNNFFFTLVYEEKVLLSSEDKTFFGKILGVQEGYRDIVEIDSLISVGRWISPLSNEVVVSYLAADKLDLGLFNFGNRLSVSVPKETDYSFNKNPFKSEVFLTSGVFNSQDENDQKIVFANLPFVQKLLNKPSDEISSVLVKSNNVGGDIKKIKAFFGEGFLVQSREQINETYYKMINTEALILNLIMVLILIIAAFNSFGAIILLIVEKKNSVKTLLKLGVTKRQLQNVFFKHGLLISLIGGFIGLVFGFLIVWAQKAFSIITLYNTSIPYPVSLNLNNFFTVFLFVFLICTTGAFFASRNSLSIKL
jgi:lipoprotein-releasing system permease protein